MTKKNVECTIPVLPVRNVESSIQYYVETLEFKVDWLGAETRKDVPLDD